MQKCAARENCELFESRNKQKREVQKCAARENCETAEKSQNCGNFRKNCAGAMDLPMRNIFRRLKKYRAPLGAAFVLLVLSTVCSVALPTLMTNIVDYGINEKDLGYVYRTCAIMAGVAVAYAGLVVAAYKIGQDAVAEFCGELRAEIYAKANSLPMDEFGKIGTGALITRSIEDADRIGDVINTLMSALSAIPFTLILGTVLAFRKDWVLAVILFAFVPVLFVVVMAVFGKIHALWKRSDEYMDKQNALIRSRLTGIRVVRAFNREPEEQKKIDRATHVMADNIIRANIQAGLLSPVCMFLLNLAVVIILCVGAVRISLPGTRLTVGGILAVRGTVGVAAVVTVVLYAKNFSSPLMQIANGLSSIQHFGSAAKEVYGFLDQEEMTTETLLLPARTEGNVEFCDVGFSYTPEKPLIEHLSFSVKAGQKVAIVGPTGAGKTTIVNLLMRFYDPVSGHIEIDGQNIEACRREAVRDKFSMVLQDTWLFEGTVYENIAYGREGVTREQVEAACRAAYCDRFIRLLPKGYDTVIDDATALSGGQKQLLTIARAFLSDRPLLILDEATSNVDTRTEILIQKAMDRLMKGKTCFVIAHRLSTIVNADMILAVDRGKIVDVGTHARLLEEGGFYAKLYNSQYAPA